VSNNREKREYATQVHMYMALQRNSKHGNKNCIRHVIKGEDSLEVFCAKIKAIGGEWRIHKTVNARDIGKAYKIFMKAMIDYPEKASCIDSEWRTALLQRNCKAEKRFMLDIDTQDEEVLAQIESLLWDVSVLYRIKSPKGWHYVTCPFDSREVCELEDVTLLRDGYHYVTTIGEGDV